MSRTTSTPLNAALNGEPACICKAWTIHCGCGKSISHEDVAKLRRKVKRLRKALRRIVALHKAYEIDLRVLDALLNFDTARTIADTALTREGQ